MNGTDTPSRNKVIVKTILYNSSAFQTRQLLCRTFGIFDISSARETDKKALHQWWVTEIWQSGFT